jgi:hypothetical protein
MAGRGLGGHIMYIHVNKRKNDKVIKNTPYKKRLVEWLKW